MYELVQQTDNFLEPGTNQLYFLPVSNDKWIYHEHITCAPLAYDQRCLSLLQHIPCDIMS